MTTSEYLLVSLHRVPEWAPAMLRDLGTEQAIERLAGACV